MFDVTIHCKDVRSHGDHECITSVFDLLNPGKNMCGDLYEGKIGTHGLMANIPRGRFRPPFQPQLSRLSQWHYSFCPLIHVSYILKDWMKV